MFPSLKGTNNIILFMEVGVRQTPHFSTKQQPSEHYIPEPNYEIDPNYE
jgi:hypothetical protein